MSGRRIRHSLQFEIVANLFVLMLSGLALVALVMGALAAQMVDRAALRELRVGARYLERTLAVGEAMRLADLGAWVRTVDPRALGGQWVVLDERGRSLASPPGEAAPRPELLALAERTRAGRKAIVGGALPFRDRMLAQRVSTRSGERGVLVGRVSSEELATRLLPMLRSAAWVVAIAALVFVVFGAYLLRRRIVVPIQRLSALTRRIAEGDLQVSVETTGADELTELGHSFNRMARSLAAGREALLGAQRSLSQHERLAAVGQLAAGVAHEVGNPIAAIMGYSELLKRDPELSRRSRDANERIHFEALRVRTLVRELLDLARSESFELCALDPAQFLEQTLERMRPQGLLEGVATSIRIEPDLPLVFGDLRRIEQILANLIENAAHAVRGLEGARIELCARAERAGSGPGRRYDDPARPARVTSRVPDEVAIEVIDNGGGIEDEDLPHLFDPFFTTKDPGEGTGLGLWNCFRIAQLLGGRLEVETRPGHTCFSLILPVADREAQYGPAAHPDHR